MKKFFLSIIILIFSINTSFGHVEHYSNLNHLEYELFRNDKLIGFHVYDFKRNGDLLTIESKVEFKISKLGVNLYNYEATSTEEYTENLFTKFSSKTIQNKKNKYVNIDFNSKDNNLTIEGSSYKGPASKESIVGTWWNHEIVKSKAQISAISGRIIEQNVEFKGKEELIINGKKYKTLRYNFSSSDPNLAENKKLNTDIWYEENTFLWIKASFEKMGQWEYRLKTYK
ncbi:MAG: hypothetical protein CBE47_00445 [Pelagibacteraceae bacterium TMED287]|nr:MAG: hypothetical protein CBE47_00445 [Pelagibacteraceae bacterium TMED287]